MTSRISHVSPSAQSLNRRTLPVELKNSFAEALTAIQEVSDYKEQALPKMKETILMFSDMADEGQKVVDKIEMGNNDLLE